MAFGQQSGPPASAKQVAYLLSLVQDAGFDGFRDARHPLDLTQRQAGGKFTTREASDLIDRLLAGELGDPADDEPVDPAPPPARRNPSTATSTSTGGSRPASGRGSTRRSTSGPDAATTRAQQRLDDQRAELLAGMPADLLVAELERRGWRCSPPDQ